MCTEGTFSVKGIYKCAVGKSYTIFLLFAMSGDIFLTSFSEIGNREFYNELLWIVFIKGYVDRIHDADPAIGIQLLCDILGTAGFFSGIFLFQYTG